MRVATREAYFVIRGDRVQLRELAAAGELAVEISKGYANDAGDLPQAEMKRIAMKVAKAAIPKLR